MYVFQMSVGCLNIKIIVIHFRELHNIPGIGVSPTRPVSFPVIPPVEVQDTTLPSTSRPTAPTVPSELHIIDLEKKIFSTSLMPTQCGIYEGVSLKKNRH